MKNCRGHCEELEKELSRGLNGCYATVGASEVHECEG